jgi:hypothetical protein
MSRRNRRGFGSFLTYWFFLVFAIVIPVIWYLAIQGHLNILFTSPK